MKKNSFKRIAALLLLVVMITSCIPCIAFADSKYTGTFDAYDPSGTKIGTMTVNDNSANLSVSGSLAQHNKTYDFKWTMPKDDQNPTGDLFMWTQAMNTETITLVHNGGSTYIYGGFKTSEDRDIYLYPISYSGAYIANITESTEVTSLSFRISNYNLIVTGFDGNGNAATYKDFIKGNTYLLFKHDDTVTYNEIECYCDTFKRDKEQAFKLYFNKATNECVGFEAQFQYGVSDAKGTCELQAPQKAASTGYSITFDSAASTATITGDKLPSKIYVKEDGSTSDPQEIDGNSFVFENKVYEITFTVDGNAYTMHANCKIKDVQFTTDTRYLEDVVADMDAYLGYMSSYDINYLSNSDDLPLDKKIYYTVPSSVFNDFQLSYVAATGVLADEESDQSDIDAAANDARKATNAFFNYLVLPYVEFNEQSNKIVPIDYSAYSGAAITTLDYAVGLFASRAEVPSGSIAAVGDGIAYKENEVYTLFTTEKLFGKERSSVSYFAVKLCDLQTWIKANVSEDQKGKLVEYVPYIDNSGTEYESLKYPKNLFDDLINAYFDVTKPEPQQGGKEPCAPGEEKTITDLIEFTVSGDEISWESKSDSVVVERVSYAPGKTTDVGGSVDAKYMPLPKSENSFKALAKQDHTIKMLLRTGDTVKTFYYLVKADQITADCNTPIVQKYSGAVAAYSRGFEATSIAYVAGNTYNTLADAKAAEIADQSTVKVYYVKDGATLDSTAFAPDSTYTFFFVGASETKTLVVEF